MRAFRASLEPPVVRERRQVLPIGIHISLEQGRSVENAVAHCRAIGVGLIAIDATCLEWWLGRPVPIVPLDPPPDDPIALGLLELEEDVLRDSYELARSSFEGELRKWRATVSLDRLTHAFRELTDAGLVVALVDWRSFDVHIAEDLDYVRRVSAAFGQTRACVRGTHDVLRQFAALDMNRSSRVVFAFGASQRAQLAAGSADTPFDVVLEVSELDASSAVDVRDAVTSAPQRVAALFVRLSSSRSLAEAQATLDDFELDRPWPFPVIVEAPSLTAS